MERLGGQIFFGCCFFASATAATQKKKAPGTNQGALIREPARTAKRCIRSSKSKLDIAGRQMFHDVTCLVCGAPLSGRDGEFVVKYFLLRHGARRKLRRVHDPDPA